MNFSIIKGFFLEQLTTKTIAISAIKFAVLRKITKFTNREPQNYDPFDPYKSASVALEDINKNYYQRLTNDERISEIYNYLLKEINNKISGQNNAIGTFPTSIIISLDLNEDFENIDSYQKFISDIEKDRDDFYGAFLKNEKNQELEILIPHNKISLIVDGQHRMAGMLKLYNDAVNNIIKIGRKNLQEIFPLLTNDIVKQHLDEFSFGCTLLVGFDLWEQGKVFGDVNFNQKPVNKSLYYDIFGSLPNPDRNEIFLAHMLAMHLNNNEDSPLNGFIKMLGTGNGFFSQAFFVEAILTLFKPKNIWGSFPLDYLKGGNQHKLLPKFLKGYFNAIKIVFSDFWPKADEKTSWSYKSILVKTTGMGALIRLIQPIYLQLKKNNTNLEDLSQTEIENQLTAIFEKIKAKGKTYFSKDGDYAAGGSNGLQVRLFNLIFNDLKTTKVLS